MSFLDLGPRSFTYEKNLLFSEITGPFSTKFGRYVLTNMMHLMIFFYKFSVEVLTPKVSQHVLSSRRLCFSIVLNHVFCSARLVVSALKLENRLGYLHEKFI